MNINDVPKPTVERLSLYLRRLKQLQKQKVKTISSRELARLLDTKDAQVRKDLAYFGAFGKRGVGYHVGELTWNLTDILQLNQERCIAVIGAGNLGRALVTHKEFARKGFLIKGIFDIDPAKIGKSCGPLKTRDMSHLAECTKEGCLCMAIIAVPAPNAQEAVDAVVKAGIRHILNFSPFAVTVPNSIQLRSVDISLELEQLSFGM